MNHATQHDIHARTATNNELVAVAAILADHRGEAHAITSGEIADVMDLESHDSTPKTRGIIRRLTEEFGLPIAASTKGYYMISDGLEASEYLRDLEGRMYGIQARKENVCTAVETRGVADSEATVQQWLDDVERRTQKMEMGEGVSE